MTEMNTKLLRTLRTDLDAALAAVAKKHGIALGIGNFSYSTIDGTARTKLEVAVVDKKTAKSAGSSAAVSPKMLQARKDFKHHAKSYGLEPSWLDRKVFIGRSRMIFQIVGLNPSRPKYCVLIKNEKNGRIEAATADLIENADWADE